MVKAAVNTHHAHGAVGQVLPHIGHAQAHDWSTTARAHRSQCRMPLGKLAHLQSLGVTHQFADVAHQGFFRAESMGDGKTAVFEQGLLAFERHRTHAHDAGRNIEQHLRHLAGHQIGFVLRGAGDQHVGVGRAGLGQHLGADAVADHATQVKARFQITQAHAVGIDHGDIVFFADQAFSDAFADATSAQNQDFHN